MQCPAGCSTALVMAERSGVEIDYCPTCRGVWLDRGELDKIIERSSGFGPPQEAPAAQPPPAQPAPAMPPPQTHTASAYTYGSPPPGGYGQPGYGQPGYGQPGYGKKKKRGFLEDLFDF